MARIRPDWLTRACLLGDDRAEPAPSNGSDDTDLELALMAMGAKPARVVTPAFEKPPPQPPGMARWS